MTAIKPPGSPGSSSVGGAAPGEPRQPAEKVTGTPFADRVGGANPTDATNAANATGPTGGSSAAKPTGGPDSSASVVADLRAGRVKPDEAVRRLTDLAVQRSGAPASVRPAVEENVRALLENDPTVASLLRRMGASVPPPTDE